MSTEPAVVIRDLHKAYGDVEAVAGIDLTIAHGRRKVQHSAS
jgi:ABC-type histidine transport system ATPase subunit